MIRMVEPKEGDVICDPASGSGGFLIRFFEIVREQILRDVDNEYRKYKEEIEAKKYTKKKKAELLRQKYEQLQRQINPYASRAESSRDDRQDQNRNPFYRALSCVAGAGGHAWDCPS